MTAQNKCLLAVLSGLILIGVLLYAEGYIQKASKAIKNRSGKPVYIAAYWMPKK